MTFPRLSRPARALPFFAAACLMLILSTPARAWNATGHMAVAELAWRQLTPAQRQQIVALLKQHPHYKQLLTRDVPAGVDEGEWAFLTAATWPDLVRPGFAGEGARPQSFTQYHHAEWHYITVFDLRAQGAGRRGRRGRGAPTTTPADELATSQPAFNPPASATQPIDDQIAAAPKPNSLTAYQSSVLALSSPATPAADRAVSLCWIEHLAGDIHQPLHNCSLLSSTYPEGDKGGNGQAVNINGHIMNLHAVWDDMLGTGTDLTLITFLADRIAANPANDPSRLPEETRNAEVGNWVKESYAYCISFAYNNNRLETVPMADYTSHTVSADQVPGLPEAYAENGRALCEQRIALAGYRLARQISAIFPATP